MGRLRPTGLRPSGVPSSPFRPGNRILSFGTSGLPWTVDGTSGQAFPADASEWTAFIAANSLGISNPDHLHNCQDASGNFSDSIGNDELVPGASHLYQQDVTGYSRKGIKFNAGYVVSSTYSPASTSQFTLMVMAHQVYANRYFYQYGANAAPGIRLYYNGNFLNLLADGDDDSGATGTTAMRAYFAQYDRANTTTFAGDETQFLRGTAALTGAGSLFIGALPSAGSTNATCIYIARWVGAAAEAMTESKVMALLDAMGFTTSWWNVDATSGISLPESSLEWHSFVKAKQLALGVPDWLHLMQEPVATTIFSDTVGTLHYTCSNTQNVAFEQPIPGYSRLAAGYLGTEAQDATDRWAIRSLNYGPNPSGSSVAQFGLFHSIGTPQAAYGILNFGVGASNMGITQLTNDVIRYRQVSNITDSVNTYPSGTVFFAGLVHNISASIDRAYTNQEKISPNYGTPGSGTMIGVGDIGAGWTRVRCGYEFGYSGSHADLCTDANVKALWEAMGLTVPWS